MKKIPLWTLLLLGTAFAIHTLVKSQPKPESVNDDDEEEETDYSFAVESKKAEPDIVDFINAILTQEDYGEKLAEMEENWVKHLSDGQALPEGRAFIVCPKEGYVRYDATFPADADTPFSEYMYIEYRTMHCSAPGQTLLVENVANFRDGQPFLGQFSGLTFFLYDNKTRRMEQAYAYDLGAKFYEPEETVVAVHRLPPEGNTIECTCHTQTGDTILHLTWDGSSFTVK